MGRRQCREMTTGRSVDGSEERKRKWSKKMHGGKRAEMEMKNEEEKVVEEDAGDEKGAGEVRSQ